MCLFDLRHQGKTEFAALGQGQAAAPGGLVVRAAQLDQQGHHAALDQHQAQGHRQNQPTLCGKLLQIDKHADADKEQAEENVAERADVRLDLVAIMAFAQQHAGQKRAQRHRQPQHVGQPGRQQHNHQGQGDKQLRRTSGRHFMEQPWQHPATGQ